MKIGNLHLKKHKTKDVIVITNADGEVKEVPRFIVDIALEIVFVNAE